MEYSLDRAAQRRLEDYFSDIGRLLGRRERRESFATYALGLFGNSERKSVEPIAAAACSDPGATDAMHQRLLNFVGTSRWSDREVRRFVAGYGLAAINLREPIEAWILDDTGFLKQGRHSVGVQRQYTGSAGKIANCQLGVSLTLCSRTMHLPVDFELYLPRCWTDDAERRLEAQIPPEVEFQTKPELGLQMVERAVADGWPPGVVLADTAYGNGSRFRRRLRGLGLGYAVDVQGTTKVRQLDKRGRRYGPAITVKDLAMSSGMRRYRRTTWREGSKQLLWSNFVTCRVRPVHDDTGEDEPENVILLCEWPPGEAEPTKFVFTTQKHLTRKALVRFVKQRWRTERVYEDMKGELGLDHYEGRRFGGWHHHVTTALCCYAFVAAEHARSFPPSGQRSRRARAHRTTTGAAF